MERLYLSVLIFAVLLNVPEAQKLPSFIVERCSLSDSSSTSCLTAAAQTALQHMAGGIPELNVPGIDPLNCNDIRVEQQSIKLKIKKPYINGLKDCKINDFRIDPIKKRIFLDYTKNGSLHGAYEVSGQILIIPISGKGDARIDFKNLNYQFKMNYDTYTGADGNEYWKILKHKVKYSADGAHFNLTNLFNGNKQLGDATLNVLNENWQVIFNDLSPPIMVEVTKSIVDVLKKLFEAIPVKELFLP